jgi:inosine/xanthosine triphosphatase
MQTSLKIIVGSKNPVKVNAAKFAFSRCYPECEIDCQGMNAPSNVAEQPITAAETLLGAQNRVRYCKTQKQADFYVAFEGGVDRFEYGPSTFAYVVIANQHKESVGRSAILPLPEKIYQALCDGEELGPLMDSLFDTDNIKQKGGAIGLLTNGLESREGNYRQAIILAMAPFLHRELYP